MVETFYVHHMAKINPENAAAITAAKQPLKLVEAAPCFARTQQWP